MAKTKKSHKANFNNISKQYILNNKRVHLYMTKEYWSILYKTLHKSNEYILKQIYWHFILVFLSQPLFLVLI